MSKNLIGAVAIEDNEISFISCISAPGVRRWRQHSLYIEPDIIIKRVPKPKDGYSKLFIEEEIRDYFDCAKDDLISICISMFGVINTKTSTVISVPRKDWFLEEEVLNINLNFASFFNDRRWKKLRIEVRNDATTAALRESEEHEEGGSREDVFAYVRVGAGINAGALWRGFPFGHLHPEVGHVRPIRHSYDDKYCFDGCCRFHEDCIDGLASTSAIEERRKHMSEYEVWRIQAYYLAQLCVILNLTLAPSCIVLGGAAMSDEFIENNAEKFYDYIREDFETLVGDYPRHEENSEVARFIRPAKVTEDASLWGALSLAQSCAKGKNVTTINPNLT